MFYFCISLLKTNLLSTWFYHLTFLLFKLRFVWFTKVTFDQFVFIDKTSPPGFYLRVPPQGLTLGFHLRVPPQGPTLTSWVPRLRYARFFCYCYFIKHVKWDVIISSSLRWLLKMWEICQNRIEKSGFYKKVRINRAGCSYLYIARNCTQDNVKYHPYSTWRKMT